VSPNGAYLHTAGEPFNSRACSAASPRPAAAHFPTGEIFRRANSIMQARMDYYYDLCR
jgi:hypothetical protein